MQFVGSAVAVDIAIVLPRSLVLGLDVVFLGKTLGSCVLKASVVLVSIDTLD